ncbi:MAG: Hsp20/alpha crystallin family protein [Planctomycetaceae bacterium]
MVTRSETAAPVRPARSPSYQPHVDIRDAGREVVFVADIPGAAADGIDVTFDDGVLSLRATVPPRHLPGQSVRQEYGVGDYRRSFRLGEGFDAAAIAADYRRGVLTVHVPRLAAAQPRKVPVVAAS